MMLPILMSVSLAPGSYFFCAKTGVVTSTPAASRTRAARFLRRPGIGVSPVFCRLVLRRVSQGGQPLASAGIFRPAKRWVGNLPDALQNSQSPSVDHDQRTPDDDRAGDLAYGDRLAQHQPSQMYGGDGNEQRHQHDVGCA